MKVAAKRRARRRAKPIVEAPPVAKPSAHPIGRSFLGEHYKRWRHSSDAKTFAGNELNCYCAFNDVSDETRDELRAWEKAGFP